MLSFAHAKVEPLHSVYEIWNCQLLIDDYCLTWDEDYVSFSRSVDILVPAAHERNFAYQTLQSFVASQSLLVQFPLSIRDFRWHLIDDKGVVEDSREKYKSIEFSKLQAIDPDVFGKHLPASQRVLELLPNHPELFFALTDFNLAYNAETDDLRLMYAWRAWEQLRGGMPGENRKQKGEALLKLLPNVSARDFEFLQSVTNADFILNRHASEDPSKTSLPSPMDTQMFQLIVRNAIVNYVSYLFSINKGS